jgi:hypothetical protein
MKIIRLLSVEKFRDLFPVNEDVDATIVKKVLYRAQSVKVLQFLGTELYKKITTLVDSGDINLVANVKYKLLLDEHVQNICGYWGYHRVIPHLSWQITDKGVQQRDGNHSKPASDAVITKQQKIAENDAEFVTDLMVKFICKNSADYPEYGQIDEGIGANRKPYFSGMQFGHGDGTVDGLENP